MRKLPAIVLASFASLPLLAQAQAAAAPAPDYTWANKVSLYSEYEYRGISQTSEKPALQYNGDFSHSSGFYAGTFITNIKWLKDTAEVGGFSTNAKIEVDLFAGYKFEVVKDVTLDVGYLRYEYPQSKAFNPKPNTDEIYIGASYGPVSVKYSYSINDTFGVANSKGSDFIEVNLAYPVMDKLTLTGHLGYQKYKGTQIHGFHNGDLSYTVYKVGLVYDIGSGWNAGGYVKGTDGDSALYTIKGKDWAKDRLVGFVSYSF